MKEWALSGQMNITESRKAIKEIQRIDDALRSGSDDEKHVLMHRFHNEYLDKGIEKLEEKYEYFQFNLIRDYLKYMERTFIARVNSFYKAYYEDQIELATLQEEIDNESQN